MEIPPTSLGTYHHQPPQSTDMTFGIVIVTGASGSLGGAFIQNLLSTSYHGIFIVHGLSAQSLGTLKQILPMCQHVNGSGGVMPEANIVGIRDSHRVRPSRSYTFYSRFSTCSSPRSRFGRQRNQRAIHISRVLMRRSWVLIQKL